MKKQKAKNERLSGAIAIVVSMMLTGQAAMATDHAVKMKSISFDPKIVTVKVGDSIRWENTSLTEHSATSDSVKPEDFRFETASVKPGAKSKPIEFKVPGTIGYHCSVHGKSMSGKVVVEK